MSAAGLLSDLRVLAPPEGDAIRFCARLLAQLGADVQVHGNPADFELVLQGETAPGGGPSPRSAPPGGRVVLSITPYGLSGPYLTAPKAAPPPSTDSTGASAERSRGDATRATADIGRADLWNRS